MVGPLTLFEQLNRDYLTVHKTKEDLFWNTYTGIVNAPADFAHAEQAYKDFISSPKRLTAVRQALSELSAMPDGPDKAALHKGLSGWQALFEYHILDSAAARDEMRELINMESELFAKNRQHALTHLNEQGVREEATLGMLQIKLATNPNELARKSAYDALRLQERWALDNGLLDVIRQRNQMAYSLGYRNFFDYKVRKNEQMSPEALFAILDDFEARTRDASRRALSTVERKDEGTLAPWNLLFHMNGDITRQLDPYLPFAKTVERWLLSFRRMGITHRGAELQLDLQARPGKYQNVFCHSPRPSFVDGEGNWVAAQVNLSADARPDQAGGGERALGALFHAAGHAAHFANIVQNSPCFSQEFSPTSMAYTETQSLFFESLLGDADWLKRYAQNASGDAPSDRLIRARIEATQPFRAFMERLPLVVAYFEWALYQLPDAELTPNNVLQLARTTEQRILGVAASPRPVLATPQLLNQESAADHHGYLLAKMAAYQTRAHFERAYGYLTDNPAIGPKLAEHYWAPGNSISHNSTLLSLTGEPFNARYLADVCNRTVDEAWESAQAQIAAATKRSGLGEQVMGLDAYIRLVHGAELIADNSKTGEPFNARYLADVCNRTVDEAWESAQAQIAAATKRSGLGEQVMGLDAYIRLVHGAELIADNSKSDAAMCDRFETWVAGRYPASVH